MGTKTSEAVQESNCPALAFVTCGDKDHVERRGVSPAVPGWLRGVGGGTWGASGPMASVTQQQIQKVRSCPAGRERVQSAGRCVRHTHCQFTSQV